MLMCGGVPQERAAFFKDCLQAYLGMGKRFSVKAIAEASGISERALYSYHSGKVVLPSDALLALMSVLPESFANMVLGNAGLSGASKIEGDYVPAQKVLSSLLENSADLSKKLEDRDISASEAMALRKSLPVLIAELAAFNASLEKN